MLHQELGQWRQHLQYSPLVCLELNEPRLWRNYVTVWAFEVVGKHVEDPIPKICLDVHSCLSSRPRYGNACLYPAE